MAVDLPPMGDFELVDGVSIATCSAAIKYKNRDDLVIFSLVPGTTSAAVFTSNSFAAAPVRIARNHLANRPLYWLINAGNANAATGEQGMDDAVETCRYLARIAQVSHEQVLPFSTGVIGERLPLDPFRKSMPLLFNSLSDNAWHKAAKAIMTTDTRAKGISIVCAFGQETFTINGIVKGSGMIHPNMATMLAFIATDIRAGSSILQECLQLAVGSSFHHISVDGDTSTNDAVALAATAKSNLPCLDDDTRLLDVFQEQLNNVCKSLAEAVIRDAEGASRFVTITVVGASDRTQANHLAKTIALSPLVKTALFAGDPNWGRILCAAGYSGIDGLDPDKISITVNELPIVTRGMVSPQYTEERGLQAFSHHDIEIVVGLGIGTETGYCLTCDLGHDYISINSDYRS